jgi:hypothetical protein
MGVHGALVIPGRSTKAPGTPSDNHRIDWLKHLRDSRRMRRQVTRDELSCRAGQERALVVERHRPPACHRQSA